MKKKNLFLHTKYAFLIVSQLSLNLALASPSSGSFNPEDAEPNYSCPNVPSCPKLCPTPYPTPKEPTCPKITPTINPSPTPTPTPVNQCPFYKASTNYTYKGHGTTTKKAEIITQNQDAPDCFTKGVEKLYDECSALWKGTPRATDDCVLDVLSSDKDYYKSLPRPSADALRLKNIIQVGYNATCSSSRGAKECGVANSWMSPSSATFYFNASCEPVYMADKDLKKACGAGTVNIYGSPISLLLDTKYEDLSTNSNIVKFKLKPNSGEFTEWKASEKAPLLVFDPEHTGKINSAEQLFGEWAFGGKASAFLTGITKIDSANVNNTWENGYAALATLDSNLNGKIDGAELEPLSVWFDKNQNAISEPGEVQNISSIGIKALYYKGTEKDLLSKDVILKVGYDREVNGKTIQGTTVDWYSVTANSLAELNQRKEVLNSLCGSNANKTSQDEKIISPVSETSSLSNSHNAFAGSWIWKSNDDQKSQGLLVFGSEVRNNAVRGISLFTMNLDNRNEKSGNVAEAGNIIELSGRLLEDKGQFPKLVFTHDGSDGSLLESTVQISTDQKQLEGTTVISNIQNGKKKIISSYAWTAERKG